MGMSWSVSKSSFETQGCGERVPGGEQKLPTDCSETWIDTETYQTMLAKELLFYDMQEDYSKSF